MNKEIKKIIIIHGNGCDNQSNWSPWLTVELERLGYHVVNRSFPDSLRARSHIWLPFLKHDLKADEHTLIIGHSSGALAAMRYAQENKIYGAILVGAYHTHLGVENERLSGYFDAPWSWSAIKQNQRYIAVLASIDDPFIPIHEPQLIAQMLNADLLPVHRKRPFYGCNDS